MWKIKYASVAKVLVNDNQLLDVKRACLALLSQTEEWGIQQQSAGLQEAWFFLSLHNIVLGLR